jgi:hypothetical protein
MLSLISILALVGIVILVLISKQLRAISVGILRVSHQMEYLGAPLDLRDGMLVAARRPASPRPAYEEILIDSRVALLQAVGDLKHELGDQMSTIRRLLKPTAYVSELQVNTMQPEQVAEKSRNADHLIEAIDQIKLALFQEEMQQSRLEQERKKLDEETQAKLRQEKRIHKIQLRCSQTPGDQHE